MDNDATKIADNATIVTREFLLYIEQKQAIVESYIVCDSGVI